MHSSKSLKYNSTAFVSNPKPTNLKPRAAKALNKSTPQRSSRTHDSMCLGLFDEQHLILRPDLAEESPGWVFCRVEFF